MNFYDDLERGHDGEKAILELLKEKGYNAESVSEDPEYYYTGDIRLRSNDCDYFIEVKTSWTAHKYGTFYVESTNRYGKPGWLEHNDYQYIAFYDAVLKKAYFISITNLLVILQDEPPIYNRWGDRYFAPSVGKIKKYAEEVVKL